MKNGESPVVPQLPDTESAVFAGWFEGELSGNSVRFGKTGYDFNSVAITDNRTVRLFARYGAFADVVFHDQYNSGLSDYPVMYTRRGELVNGSAKVRISDISAIYSGSGKLAFYGWSETAVQKPGDGGTPIPAEGGYVAVSATEHLYPLFQPVHWLNFYSGPEHSGASYVPETYVFDVAGAEGPLTVPKRAGYRFGGWYAGVLSENEVTYSTRITDESGGFIAGISGDGFRLYGGKLLLSKDLTLYASLCPR